MATNNKQQVNIGAWDAMMAKVAGMPEIEQLVAEVDRLRAEVDEGNAALHEQIQAWMSQKAEVDRLRAREQALADENAAMRPMVEALRDYAGLKRYADPCEGCGAQGQSVGSHTPDCLVTAAATFLTKHPATDTTAAESEGESEEED